MKNAGWPFYVKTVILVGLLLAVLVAASFVDLEPLFKSYSFSLDSPDIMRGPIGFVALSTVLISVSCPRQVISFFAAYFFGLWVGAGLALIAMTLSCMFTFTLARLFRERVARFVVGKIDLAVRFWRENAFLATLIWRFIPAGSNLLTNLAAGALNIPAAKFILGSALGYIPHTVIFAMLGSGISVESGPRIAISVGLFVIAIALGWVLYRRYKLSMTGPSA